MSTQDEWKLPRRHFLQALALAAPMLIGSNKAQSKTNSRVPMLQVWADNSQALVVVLGEAGWKFSAFQSPDLKIQIIKMDALSGSGRVLYRLQISGVSVSSYSQMAVYDQQNHLLDVRRLKGLDLDLPSAKIAVISCANYRKIDGQEPLYDRLEEQRPDLNLLIGDMVYSNSRSSTLFGKPEEPGSALGRYIETWNSVDMYRLEPLIPSLAVWDDHDYGTNNGDSSHPYKNQMKEIFRNFYPLPTSHERLLKGPGVAFRLSAFGIDFHMLDGRSFRVNKSTQWGAAQETWFSQDFAASKNPAWILNGTQFLKYMPIIESVQKNAAPSFAMLRSLLRRVRKPVVLFSGDVHCSQVQELSEELFGFKTIEITSSAIHSSSAGSTMRRSPEEGQLFYYGKENFIVIRTELKNSAKTLSMELFLSCATERGTYPIATSAFKIQAA